MSEGFRKSERDVAVFEAHQIANMVCTCHEPDCEVPMLQQVLALVFATQALMVIQSRQARTDIAAAFREVFG